MAGWVARNALAAIARISVATDQDRSQVARSALAARSSEVTDQDRSQVARSALAAIARSSEVTGQDRSQTLVKFNKG